MINEARESVRVAFPLKHIFHPTNIGGASVDGKDRDVKVFPPREPNRAY